MWGSHYEGHSQELMGGNILRLNQHFPTCLPSSQHQLFSRGLLVSWMWRWSAQMPTVLPHLVVTCLRVALATSLGRYADCSITTVFSQRDWFVITAWGCAQGRGDASQQQYKWHAYSPDILVNLPPAVRSMFPAVICGKQAIDKIVGTGHQMLLDDRLNICGVHGRGAETGAERSWWMVCREKRLLSNSSVVSCGNKCLFLDLFILDF